MNRAKFEIGNKINNDESKNLKMEVRASTRLISGTYECNCSPPDDIRHNMWTPFDFEYVFPTSKFPDKTFALFCIASTAAGNRIRIPSCCTEPEFWLEHPLRICPASRCTKQWLKQCQKPSKIIQLTFQFFHRHSDCLGLIHWQKSNQSD